MSFFQPWTSIPRNMSEEAFDVVKDPISTGGSVSGKDEP